MIKIAYIIDCMYNSGGMERVLTVCANALSADFDITIITAFQQGRPDFFELSPRIRRHDLGIETTLSPKQKKGKYKAALTAYLKEGKFAVTISLGGMDFDFLHFIKDGSRKVFWYHFAIDIEKTTWIGPNPTVVRKVKAHLKTWKRIFHVRKYDKLVVISKADLKNWRRYTSKAQLIYNPVTIECTHVADSKAKAVISVGRLDYQKGFDYLINVWSVVSRKHPDWHLDIYGDGPLRQQLQKLIDSQNLCTSVTLCGRTSAISEEYAEHSVYVMSSRAEGFPLVLLEAASCGLPLIAFDCPSGPSEIIEDGKNGFLITQVGDISRMAECICQLIESEKQRNVMGEKAKEIAQRFSVDNIIPQWRELIRI